MNILARHWNPSHNLTGLLIGREMLRHRPLETPLRSLAIDSSMMGLKTSTDAGLEGKSESGFWESSSCMKSDMTDRSLIRIISIDRWRTSYSCGSHRSVGASACCGTAGPSSLNSWASLIIHNCFVSYVIAAVPCVTTSGQWRLIWSEWPAGLHSGTQTNRIDHFGRDIKLAAT